MANEIIDNETGEITLVADLTTLETLARAEIDALVSTARKFPRQKPKEIQRLITELATMDATTAEEMRYALPRGKNENGSAKVISGPSIRFMEMAAQQYGNCQIGARITEVNTTQKYVEAEGVFVDSQTNVRQVARVRRRIADKYGKLYNPDMIQTTSNAAASIARRNAITMGIPKAIWNAGYEEAEKVIMGTAETLSNTRAKAIAAFTNFGLGQEQVLLLIGAEKVDDVGLEDVGNLRTMFRQLKNEEVTVEELLRRAKGTPETKTVTHANPMDDDAHAPKAAETPAEAASAPVTEPATDAAPEPEKAAPEKKPAATRKPKGKAAEAEVDPAPEAADAGSSEEDEPSPLPEVKDGKVVKPEPAAPSSTPTTEAEYIVYATAWIEAGTSASEMTDRWKAERALRREVNITNETMDSLKEKLDDAVSDL